MKNILITGSQGFIGKNLTGILRSQGHSVTEFSGDLTNSQQLDSFLERQSNIDLIYHFAGISSPTQCLEDKDLALKVNFTAACDLASKASRRFPNASFIFPSTGQVYLATDHQPLSENSQLAPINFYAETKLKAEEALQTVKDIRIVVLRLFNHAHKSQSSNFFLPSIHRQILSGSQQIKTGNLDIIRDFGALQDLLKALTLFSHKQPAEIFEIYNICSGSGKKLRAIAEELAFQLGKDVQWVADEKLLRNDEPQKIIGSCNKFRNHFHWQPVHASNERDLVQNFLADLPFEKGNFTW